MSNVPYSDVCKEDTQCVTGPVVWMNERIRESRRMFREGLYSLDRYASYLSFLQEGTNRITIGCCKFMGNDSEKNVRRQRGKSLWIRHSWEGWGSKT